MEFIEGNWYKSNRYFVKCKKLTHVGFEYDEGITCDGIHYLEKIDIKFDKSNKSMIIEEASLEEIQDYLPNGHVDKNLVELESFPNNGLVKIRGNVDDLMGLIYYLESTGRERFGTSYDTHTELAWNANNYWGRSSGTKIKPYNLKRLSKFFTIEDGFLNILGEWKVGDKFQVKLDNPNGSCLLREKVYTIEKIENGCHVKAKEIEDFNSRVHFVNMKPPVESSNYVLENFKISPLNEAAKMFPIETKFYPCQVGHKRAEYCIINTDKSDFNQGFRENNGNIYALTPGGHRNGMNGDTDDVPNGNQRIVYMNGKWAEIVASGERHPQPELMEDVNILPTRYIKVRKSLIK